MIETVFNLISLAGILALPPWAKLMGIAILAITILRGLFALMRLRIFKAASMVFSAVILAILLSQAGKAYEGYMMNRHLHSSDG